MDIATLRALLERASRDIELLRAIAGDELLDESSSEIVSECADTFEALLSAAEAAQSARAERATIAALIRVAIQSFDSGGESMRSMRAQAIEAAWSLLVDHDEPAFAAANETCDADPWAFIAHARTPEWVKSEVAAIRALTSKPNSKQ